MKSKFIATLSVLAVCGLAACGGAASDSGGNDLTFDSIVGEATLRGDDHQLLLASYFGQVAGQGKDLAFEIRSKTGADVTTPGASEACEM